jgi:uncharacterized protein
MKIIKNLCKVLDCYGTTILYNGFDNTIAVMDCELQEKLNDENSFFYKEYNADVFCEYDIEDIRLKSSKRLSHAIISLTENCNLRCKYCGYHDTRYANGTSLNDCDETTLKKALDFIATHSVDAYETTISFYGGEPFLRFDLIQFAIEYMEDKNCRGHKYIYRISTNGTFLDTEVIDYCVNKDIMLAISLDGPVFIHDRFRVYEGGQPTYADVIKNLKRIAARFPEYYEKNIHFMSVVSPPNNRSIPSDFFEKSEVHFLSVSIGDHFRNYLKEKHGLVLHAIRLERNEKAPQKIGCMSKADLLKNISYLGSLKRYMNLGDKNVQKSIFPGGFCVPLVQRICIAANGKIVLCERIDDCNPLFQFGNVTSGYDFDKINILYKYTNNVLEENCNNCWAFRFCRACFADLDKIGYSNDFCKLIRKEIEQDLINIWDFRCNNKRFDEIMQTISVE